MESLRPAGRGLNRSAKAGNRGVTEFRSDACATALAGAPAEAAMALKVLRYVLLPSLSAIVGWLLAVACFYETPRAAIPFPGASLCIHRPGP